MQVWMESDGGSAHAGLVSPFRTQNSNNHASGSDRKPVETSARRYSERIIPTSNVIDDSFVGYEKGNWQQTNSKGGDRNGFRECATIVNPYLGILKI